MKTIVVKTQAELDALQRLFSKTRKSKIGCWEFTGSIDRGGYGRLRYKKEASAHRVSYLLCVGQIRAGMDIAHDCDNRKCVNPMHLSIKSRKGNVRDALTRGRIKTGFSHSMASLTKQQVFEARRLRLNGWSLFAIGNSLKVNPETVRRHLIRLKKSRSGLGLYQGCKW